jgi:folate-binding protein YgfZ
MALRSPLHDACTRAGAHFTEEAGWHVPADFGDATAEVAAARDQAALFDRSDRSKVEVTGGEAGIFLHNLATNDIVGLPVGAGCESFLTNIKARVVAHVLVYHLLLHDGRDAYWLDAEPGQGEKIIQHLDHFLISEQVEFADRTREFAQMHLAGPTAQAVLGRAMADAVPELGPHQHMVRTIGAGVACSIRRHDALGLPGYDIVCLSTRAEAVWTRLLESGARLAGRSAYEALRIEAGTPRFGIDFDENTMAPEVGRIPETICYTKGCFLGQEPIVRARDLGHVNRVLKRLTAEASNVPPAGAKLYREGKEAGFVTSASALARSGQLVALAYVRRGNTEPGTVLDIEGPGGRIPARVEGSLAGS